jgi:hypothetical protein
MEKPSHSAHPGSSRWACLKELIIRTINQTVGKRELKLEECVAVYNAILGMPNLHPSVD